MSGFKSISELGNSPAEERRKVLRGRFDIEATETAALQMSDAVWAGARLTLLADRKAVEQQRIVVARDLALGTETIFNSLRARRAPAPNGQLPSPQADQAPCFLCRPRLRDDGRPDLAEDEFGAVQTGRVRASANWSRNSAVSGIVYGDSGMHDLLSLSRDEFRELFEAAEHYLDAARSRFPAARFAVVFINGGRRSASSVIHAHAQVTGRSDRHFAWAERIAASATRDYWHRVREVHRDLGLAVEYPGGIAWASLVPVKERELNATSQSLAAGAEMLHSILQTLQRHGTNSYSLTAILKPGRTNGDTVPTRFRRWPQVLWRLVDRGDAHTPHADIGSMELLAGSAVVATDPFEVAGWLRQDAAAQADNA